MVDCDDCEGCKGHALPKVIVVLCIVGIILTAVLVPLSVTTLNFDEVGLPFNTLSKELGDELLREGLHNVGPSTDIFRFRTTQRSTQFVNLLSLSSDSLSISLSITVTHTIKADAASIRAILLTFGDQDTYDLSLRTRISSAIHDSALNFTASQFFLQRQAFQSALQTELASLFATSTVHSVLNLVQVVNIDLPQSVEGLLNNVTAAEQDIQNAIAERALAVGEAQILVELAEGEATLVVLEAERQVAEIEQATAQEVNATQTRYAQRLFAFTNASTHLGVTGDDFATVFLNPLVVASNAGKGVISL